MARFKPGPRWGWLFAVITIGVCAAVGSTWDLRTSPASNVFNGISAPSQDFAIGVANGGEIVHIRNGDDGILVTSGTTNDLFDVFAASPQAAIAAGRDIVLYWDGSSWETIISSTGDLIYTGVWISPQEDAALYGQLGTGFGFNFICPYDPNATTQQGFCRAYQSPMLTACGDSDDIKVIMGSGDVLHIDNELADLSGIEGAYDEPGNLGFTGAWPVPGSCQPGPLAPLEIYATRTNQIWRFDGTQWANQSVPIPVEHTLTWIGGTGPDNVFAVGFEPSMTPGENLGVVWRYDGVSWSEQTLPPDTPGLTDIAANLSFDDSLFVDDFEAASAKQMSAASRGGSAGLGVDILAAAENGKFIRNTQLFPGDASDLKVVKELVTLPPYRNGDQIEFSLSVFNLGPGDAANFRFIDGYDQRALQLVTDSCGMTEFNFQAGWRYREVTVPMLVAGDVLTCTMMFTVTGTAGDQIFNYAAADDWNDTNYRNNRDSVFEVQISP